MRMTVAAGLALAGMAAVAVPARAQAESRQVTFAKDVAPILQRSCENCHRPGGGAPMSLITYEDLRPRRPCAGRRSSTGVPGHAQPPGVAYVLRVMAHDGGSISNEQVTVTVKADQTSAP